MKVTNHQQDTPPFLPAPEHKIRLYLLPIGIHPIGLFRVGWLVGISQVQFSNRSQLSEKILLEFFVPLIDERAALLGGQDLMGAQPAHQLLWQFWCQRLLFSCRSSFGAAAGGPTIRVIIIGLQSVHRPQTAASSREQVLQLRCQKEIR